MASKKIKIIWGVVISVAAIQVTLGNGCSGPLTGFDASSTSAGTNADTSGGTVAPSSSYEVIPGAKTVSLLYANQILDQMTACVGVTSPSDATIKMFTDKKGAVSTYGTPDSMNPAMMMSVISIAGEVCNDLINQEIAAGSRIFKGVDLKSNQLPADGDLRAGITRLALSCWNRQEDNEEQRVLLDLIYQNVANGEQSAARKSALLACTSVLSSLDSLLN